MLELNLSSNFFFSVDITQVFSSGCLHDLRNEELKVSEEEERRKGEERRQG